LSRKLRYWYPGAMYHVTSRGNRKSAIFYDDPDRFAYLDILREAQNDFPFYLHSYCLMTNHIHLQIETIQHHPKDIMKYLNFKYAIYFNKRHDLDGHVFQGRYKSELILSIDYFLKANRYIHLNPVEASIVHSPGAYPWSSYAAYISKTENKLVTTEKILSFFPEPKLENYRKFVEEKKEETELVSNMVTR